MGYPNFNEIFDIHTDASKTQLGAVISQNGKPIAFYSRKLNPAQTRYTTTERELLAIVETLKEFKNILIGQRIRVYTDHKNLTYANFNTDRVMRWRLILEEFGPTLIYVKGTNNAAADAMSRLELVENNVNDNQSDIPSIHQMSDCFGLDEDDLEKLPFTYNSLLRHQQNDQALLRKYSEENCEYTINTFLGAGTARKLICYKDKIVVPEILQIPLVKWYHTNLCHPGQKRTEETIKQHFYWLNLRDTVQTICEKCPVCQKTKRHNKKYGKLPPKEAEGEPWDTLCIDLIGPYKFNQPNQKKPVVLWACTMIDPATGWFEIKDIKSKRADIIANVVEKTWLTRYPWPTQVVYDRGNEFMAEFSTMIKDYGITKRPITKRNPQANSIIERIHQTIGNILRTFRVQKNELDEEDPWGGILSATMFATRATVHTTLQKTPMQLVFGRDAILNISHDACWKIIRDKKQKQIIKNNARENKSRIDHTYKIGDQVLIKNDQSSKYARQAYSGPYKITAVNTNGTVKLKKGIIEETWNIRNIHPYKS